MRKASEVQKVSQQYVLAGEAKDVDAAKQGEILFYREADLPPGIYTMETIVFDAIAQRGSARMSTLTVPPAEHRRLAMSSLILVRRVEEIGGVDQRHDARFYVGQTHCSTRTSASRFRRSSRDLPFFFTIYGDVPAADGTSRSCCAMVRRSPKRRSSSAAETDSRIQQLARLPIAALATGTYELRVKVTELAARASRSAFFTLLD